MLSRLKLRLEHAMVCPDSLFSVDSDAMCDVHPVRIPNPRSCRVLRRAWVPFGPFARRSGQVVIFTGLVSHVDFPAHDSLENNPIVLIARVLFAVSLRAVTQASWRSRHSYGKFSSRHQDWTRKK
ncbi:hypothetical protein LIA77_02689 [Sarocladium implicatum]|nr:hypothetical protein LIA77_02689 [Sarocladium implicatum]